VAVVPFDDEDEAVAIANDSPYGLSGSIWSGDGGRALRVARALEAGTLSINSNSSVRVSTPFGRLQAERPRPRALDAGPRRVQRAQDRLRLDSP
jgi:acyl-CoA reductase-like NAD-dependent aldehyde dehydrogenase